MWEGVCRREKGISLPGYEAVMLAAILWLQATLVTECASNGCGPWADCIQKAQLNDLMVVIWQRLSNTLGIVKGQRDADVKKRPEPHEARKVSIFNH